MDPIKKLSPIRNSKHSAWLVRAAILTLLLAASCRPTPAPARQAEPATPTGPGESIPAASAPRSPGAVWSALQFSTPIPSGRALPEQATTPVDGSYAKHDPSWPQWWACRRCADYRPAGGIWKLQLERGVMRIFYEVTRWRSIASYTVAGDRLWIFNDPYCPQEVGEYHWRKDGAGLVLSVVEDPCSFGLRGKNLSRQAWLSCQPPDARAATSGHWNRPAGCQWIQPELGPLADPQMPLVVEVFPGEVHKSANPPDLRAHAGADGPPLPSGILLLRSPGSIAYGLNLVLWQEHDWIEVSTETAFASMGVQFSGDETIGWARVLFDGVEVWRGDTSTISSRQGRFGGYVQVSGFPSGAHTLRAERLGFDSRPVTVAFFGFSR